MSNFSAQKISIVLSAGTFYLIKLINDPPASPAFARFNSQTNTFMDPIPESFDKDKTIQQVKDLLGIK